MVLSRQQLRRVLRTDGWLTADEAQGLAALAANTDSSHVIVEIGSYRGRSTIALALGSRGASVFAVDPHEHLIGPLGGEFGPADRREMFRNLLRAKVAERVALLEVSSEVLAPGWQRPVGLLWVDGDHTYEGVRRDVQCWEPHLVSGGLVAFHDAADPSGGPYRVIEELLASGFERVQQIGSVAVLRKPLRETVDDTGIRSMEVDTDSVSV